MTRKPYFHTRVMAICLWVSISIQSHAQDFDAYTETSEVAGMINRYQRDCEAIRTFYSPNQRGRGAYAYQRMVSSPKQIERLKAIANDYQKQLEALPFDRFNVNGQVDFLLLKRWIENDLAQLVEEEKQFMEVAPLLPFASAIYDLEIKRLRGNTVEGETVAKSLDSLTKVVKHSSADLNATSKMDISLATYAQRSVEGLRSRLANVFNFYNGYDPMFTWWVPSTYKELDSLLDGYAKAVVKLGELRSTQQEDSSGIKGVPVGEAKLNQLLANEYIPYSPQELIDIANREFAWCDAELLKASREMGFGNDWKSAQEKVKNSYVAPGKQPELIMKLYNDAKSFVTKRDWITWPELADETWGMIMMTPERQLVNPFFTGGWEISISYPTNTMSYDDKMMSMRGNNPYFSRGTVQHELIPGHNLEFFMNSRYKPYRKVFDTPFYIEGWALYWELLLYANGFADTPEERIGMLFWRMHRCARIIFSLNYHLGKWGPQQCIDFLVDRVGFERANAEGEVRRSFQGGYPPLYQAAYLLGGFQIMKLKEELVDGGKMSMKEFHDAFLKENILPIELMRAVLTNQKLTKDFKTKWKFYDFKK